MNLTRKDYMILDTLYQNNGITTLCALPKSKIIEKTNLSDSKIRNSLRNFISLGYIDEGAKDDKSKTYYLTEQGIQFVEDNIIKSKMIIKEFNEGKCKK